MSTPSAGDAARVPFAGKLVSEHTHVCGFFRSSDERYRVLLPVIKEGFERGDKAYHVVNPTQRAEHSRRLASVGIDAGGAQAEGQLELFDWEEAYLPDGRFDQDRMLAAWERTFEKSRRDGYPLTRLVAHMEWALQDRPGVSDLLEYEARFNHVYPNYRTLSICSYDLDEFPASTIVDVLRTHPMSLIGGLLYENPFFVPPEQFLQELKERSAGSKTVTS